MITPPERSPARDAALLSLLPRAAAEGWPAAARDPEARRLFPGGAPDMIESYIDLADRRMAEHAADALPALRLTARVRALLEARFADAAPHLAAVRRAMPILALPQNAALAARTAARTVDAIWAAAGDTSADISWYTKRAILAGVYGSTLLYWLRVEGDMARTLAFIDRRLAGVGRLGKLRARLSGASRQPVT